MARSFSMIPILFLAAFGCAGQQVRGQADAIAEIIAMAKRNGAIRCAPKDLALAEVNLERTRDELDLGNLVPAREFVAVADIHAKAAFKNSPPEKCLPKPPFIDSDGDGCQDKEDQCPNEPEDKDGFQDDDCCPDPDNDNDGILDKEDRCPNEPEDKDGFQDLDGCPDKDNDQDRVLDGDDWCPNDPEDWDNFEDQDGCPDKDNDGDKILDAQDKCPNQPEDYDGDADEDGCPDKYKLVVVTQKKIELKQQIFFATGNTRILPRSFALLDEVATVLNDMPAVRVRIEGHTDSRGSERYNLRLSQGRADSVRKYLVHRGIDPTRMEAVGYGEGRPIEDNRTGPGRAMNRRVEFIITE
ncbi:MAG: OmpA family protein [Pseudomonadota bacterium]